MIICCAFFIILAGYYLGKIKIKGICLDLAGVLVVAVIVGLFATLAQRSGFITELFPIYSNDFLQQMKFLSSLGTAIFIGVIGINSGYGLSFKNKETILCFFVGVGIVVLNMAFMFAIGKLDGQIDFSFLKGIFCGAMTSTPALAAVCENSDYAVASAGYGGAYLFGVIGTVLFVQIAGRKKKNLKVNTNTQTTNHLNYNKAEFNGIAQLSLAIVLGSLIGMIELPIIKFSLGNTGGVLCVGICIGMISKNIYGKIIEQKNFAILRDIGLVLFFVGSGLPAGISLLNHISIRSFFYGIILTMFPIIFSYILITRIIKLDRKTSLCVVSGIMTSTPAMGILLRNSNFKENISIYSTTYAGALITLVVGMSLV